MRLVFCFSISSQVSVLKTMSNISLQELKMYNPQYLERPYVVVLNKIDLPKVFFSYLSLSQAIVFLYVGCYFCLIF
jgi:GTPase involved in cell partitioning and DNA repair